jgi:N-acetylglutamate synthase-like GNAT family acetyltransferase
MKLNRMVVQADQKVFKEIIALRREVFCDEFGEKTQYVKDARDSAGIHVAFYVDKTIVGCGSVYQSTDNVFEIYGIAVKKHYRKFGMGTELLEALKKQGKEQGAKLFKAELPLEALEFFEKNNMPKTGVPVTRNGKKYITCEENLVFDGAEWVQFGGEYHAVIVREDFEACELPIRRLVNPSRWVHSTDCSDTTVCTYGFRRENGSAALAYWNSVHILSSTYAGTISFEIACLDISKISIVDLATGDIYEIPEKMKIDKGNGCMELVNIPLTDSPMLLTFGDFLLED